MSTIRGQRMVLIEIYRTMNFTRNQIIGGLILLAVFWAVILFRVLSSGT